MDCPLKSVKEMENSKCGNFDYATDVKSGMVVVHWNDNTVSNRVGCPPPQIAKRWSRAEAKRVETTQSFMVKHYSQTTGGVDRMDHNADKHCISIGSKKWRWPLFALCVDVSIQQAWHLYRATPAAETKPLDLLAVRRSIARVYLARATQTSLFGGPRGCFLAVNKRVLSGPI